MDQSRMLDADPVTRVAPALLSSVPQGIDDGMAGDLPLHILLADDAMQAMLRSAGHTVATFMQEWRGFAQAC